MAFGVDLTNGVGKIIGNMYLIYDFTTLDKLLKPLIGSLNKQKI